MHQFGIQILEPNSNSNKREEMKNKIEKEEKGCRPRKPPRPARPAPANQPNRPTNPFPSSQCIAHARAPVYLARSHWPLDPACQPHPPSIVSSSSPTPQPPTRPTPDSCGRGGLGGHAWGMTLSPCTAPTQPRTTI